VRTHGGVPSGRAKAARPVSVFPALAAKTAFSAVHSVLLIYAVCPPAGRSSSISTWNVVMNLLAAQEWRARFIVVWHLQYLYRIRASHWQSTDGAYYLADGATGLLVGRTMECGTAEQTTVP